MGVDSEERLKRLRERLEGEISVDALYLFGSRARGTFSTDSDYDIAVVSSDFEGMNFTERQRFIRPVMRDVLDDVAMDVVCYTPEEYEEGKEAFLPRIIEDEGVEIA